MMILTSGMLGNDDIVCKREDFLPWEEPMWPFRSNDFDLHCPDWANKMNEPLLFPAQVEMEELKKLPKCVLCTSEFDLIRRHTHNLIPRMKEAGIYLDHLDYSGVGHVFYRDLNEQKSELWFQDMKTVFDKFAYE